MHATDHADSDLDRLMMAAFEEMKSDYQFILVMEGAIFELQLSARPTRFRTQSEFSFYVR